VNSPHGLVLCTDLGRDEAAAAPPSSTFFFELSLTVWSCTNPGGDEAGAAARREGGQMKLRRRWPPRPSASPTAHQCWRLARTATTKRGSGRRRVDLAGWRRRVMVVVSNNDGYGGSRRRV
jgi:hypothetical protein